MAARTTTVGGLALVALLSTLVTALPASAAVSYANCTSLQKSYPHGIGRVGARDRTTGTPVTTWRKDTAGYDRAMRANRGLDRDRDAIACEKR